MRAPGKYIHGGPLESHTYKSTSLIFYFNLGVKHMPLIQNQLSEESSSAHSIEVILHVYQ